MDVYASVISALPRLLNARDAEDYVCGATMLEQLCDEWGLVPIEKGRRLTVYDRFDIDASIERKKISNFKEWQAEQKKKAA